MTGPSIILNGPVPFKHVPSTNIFSPTVYSTVNLLSDFALYHISPLSPSDFRFYGLLTSQFYMPDNFKMIHPWLNISKNPDGLQLIYDFLITAAPPFENAGSWIFKFP